MISPLFTVSMPNWNLASLANIRIISRLFSLPPFLFVSFFVHSPCLFWPPLHIKHDIPSLKTHTILFLFLPSTSLFPPPKKIEIQESQISKSTTQGVGTYCSPSYPNYPWNAQSPIWNIRGPCPPNLFSFGWYPISLSPPPQKIVICSSPFCAHCLHETKTFPLEGGASRVHGLTTHWASFSVSFQVPPDKPNPRGRKAAKTHRDLWLIIPSQSNHGSEGSDDGPSCPTFPKGVMTSYRLTNISNSTPFRRWASHVHGSKTCQASVSISISISISTYCCSFSLYLLLFIIFVLNC